ncbi:hypothetical protein SORBI_3001G300750 [Sorghum bicolor]|uniref:Leucine-rich repeat-containing N-terminal plant-type domain-containing protein n=1 Tax=Sorghum bicolor TaxID=4558 RepID=A0A1Z5S8V7_SORBI|nr:hypothetical protein SORBI_3001G300750 [Sorghum bicolor]
MDWVAGQEYMIYSLPPGEREDAVELESEERGEAEQQRTEAARLPPSPARRLPPSDLVTSEIEEDPCAFAGVSCTSSSRVTKLALGDPRAGAPGLSGTFLSTAVAMLPNLLVGNLQSAFVLVLRTVDFNKNGCGGVGGPGGGGGGGAERRGGAGGTAETRTGRRLCGHGCSALLRTVTRTGRRLARAWLSWEARFGLSKLARLCQYGRPSLAMPPSPIQ